MKRVGLEEVAGALASAEKVLLTCHRGPDGDSVGSLVALASMLRERGVPATLYNPDLVPRSLKWLPHTRSFVQRLKAQSKYDLTVVVDCGDPKLLGPDFPKPEVTGTLLAIDHHASGVPFGDLFWCDPGAAAVGVLVARLADHLGWKVSVDAAQGLYVSLVTDTGSFRYSNTNGEALRLAARLVDDAGVEPGVISERMSERGSLQRYRLMAAALQGLEVAVDGHISFMTITAEMVKAAKANWEDSEGLVNFARALRGVECGVLLTPSKYGGVRVSLRSKAKFIDAGKICKDLGGGGHPGAGGCNLPGEIPEVRKQVEEVLKQAIATFEESET